MSWFEARIPPPLLMAILMLIIWLMDSAGTELVWLQVVVAVLVILAVFILRSSLLGFYRVKTTVDPLAPERASVLVTQGVFGYSRNPMYLAMALLLQAWGLYFLGFLSVIFTIAYVAFLTHFQIKPEEKALEKVFGQEFIDYCERVRRWC